MAIFFSTREMMIKENVEDLPLENQYEPTFLLRQNHILYHAREEINIYFNPWWLLNCQDFIF